MASGDFMYCGNCWKRFPLNKHDAFITHKVSECAFQSAPLPLICCHCEQRFPDPITFILHFQQEHKLALLANPDSLLCSVTSPAPSPAIDAAVSQSPPLPPPPAAAVPRNQDAATQIELSEPIDDFFFTSTMLSSSSDKTLPVIASSKSVRFTLDKQHQSREELTVVPPPPVTPLVEVECSEKRKRCCLEEGSAKCEDVTSCPILFSSTRNVLTQTTPSSPLPCCATPPAPLGLAQITPSLSQLLGPALPVLPHSSASASLDGDVSGCVSSAAIASLMQNEGGENSTYIITSGNATHTNTATSSSSTNNNSNSSASLKLFVCSQCNATFRQKIHLKKHVWQVHTKEKPFRCPVCCYATVEKSHLNMHLRVHTGEKPYQCTVCSYRACQNSTLKAHIRKQHPNYAGQPCANCTRCFLTDLEKRRHENCCQLLCAANM